jgi:hypothetical protein
MGKAESAGARRGSRPRPTYPDELDDNTIQGLMRAKYDRVFSDAIRTWKLDRGGNQTDPAGYLWFPPGVPELSKHLR